jgi:predicted acetyltransferase
MLRLDEPSLAHRQAFIEVLPEMYEAGEWPVPPDELAQKFDEIIASIARARDPATCPAGELPHEDLWLMEGDTWVGLLTLRREIDDQLMRTGGHIGYVIRPTWRGRGYGTKLLALGLERARAYGLKRVLLTCDDDNAGSRKVIEANGGRLENIITIEGKEQPVRRYWIELNPGQFT